MSKLQRLAELIDRLNEDEGLSVASVKSIKYLAREALAEASKPEMQPSLRTINFLKGVARYDVYTDCHSARGYEICAETDGDYVLYVDACAAIIAKLADEAAS